MYKYPLDDIDCIYVYNATTEVIARNFQRLNKMDQHKTYDQVMRM